MSKSCDVITNCATGLELFIENNGDDIATLLGCGCSDGYESTKDNYCYKENKVDIKDNPKVKQIVEGATNKLYSIKGVNFYSNTQTFFSNIPIKNVSSQFIDSTNSPLNITNSSNTFWQLKMNDLIISASGGLPAGATVGLSIEDSVALTTMHCIGIGCDNEFEIYVDGNLFYKSDENTGFAYKHWHVFEFELIGGYNHYITIVGSSYSTNFNLAYELYSCDIATLIAATSDTIVQGYVIESSIDRIGGNYTQGDYGEFVLPTGHCYDPFINKANITNWEISTPCTCAVKLAEYPCECWNYIEHIDNLSPQYWNRLISVNITNLYTNCSECAENNGVVAISEREKTTALFVKIPQQKQPDKGFKECCYENIVLADSTSDDYYKNDFSGFYFERQTDSDSCDFKIVDMATNVETTITDDTYGTLTDFGDYESNADLTTFICDWKKVLVTLGAGCYQIWKVIDIGGISVTLKSDSYKLRQFTNERADGTVRIDCVMNGTIVNDGVNFNGTDFSTSQRMKGFFGDNNPKYEQDNIVHRDYTTEQITMSREDEYKLWTKELPESITSLIYDFIIFGNEIYINDYNLSNHSYKFNKFAVRLKGNSGAVYWGGNRNSAINLTFEPDKKDFRKLNC